MTAPKHPAPAAGSPRQRPGTGVVQVIHDVVWVRIPSREQLREIARQHREARA